MKDNLLLFLATILPTLVIVCTLVMSNYRQTTANVMLKILEVHDNQDLSALGRMAKEQMQKAGTYNRLLATFVSTTEVVRHLKDSGQVLCNRAAPLRGINKRVCVSLPCKKSGLEA